MKLTGWFSQDKIADNSRVQTPNNANTEQVKPADPCTGSRADPQRRGGLQGGQ